MKIELPLNELRKNLNFWGMGIVQQDTENDDECVDIFLYVKLDSGKTVITQEATFKKTENLEHDIVQKFDLEFIYDKIKVQVVMGAYELYYSKLMEFIKLLKECNIEQVQYKYVFPEGKVLINYNNVCKLFYLHELDNKEQLLLDLTT